MAICNKFANRMEELSSLLISSIIIIYKYILSHEIVHTERKILQNRKEGNFGTQHIYYTKSKFNGMAFAWIWKICSVMKKTIVPYILFYQIIVNLCLRACKCKQFCTDFVQCHHSKCIFESSNRRFLVLYIFIGDFVWCGSIWRKLGLYCQFKLEEHPIDPPTCRWNTTC